MTQLPTLVKAAAAERGRRALIQGLATDVLVACAALLLVLLPDADLSSREFWAVLGVSLVKTALTAVASYVMRLKVAPVKEAALTGGAYVVTDLEG